MIGALKEHSWGIDGLVWFVEVSSVEDDVLFT